MRAAARPRVPRRGLVARGGRARQAGLGTANRCSAACRSSSVSRRCSSCSARGRRRSRASSPKSTQTQIAGFVLVVIGLAFLGLLPWPRGTVAPGLLQGARRTGSGALLGGAFAVCAAPCIGTVLASVLVLASSTGTIARGGRPARRLLARPRSRVRARRHRVRTGDAARSAGCATTTGRSRWSQVRRSSRSACCSSSTATRGCATALEPGALAGRARNALARRAATRRRGRGAAARTAPAGAAPSRAGSRRRPVFRARAGTTTRRRAPAPGRSRAPRASHARQASSNASWASNHSPRAPSSSPCS